MHYIALDIKGLKIELTCTAKSPLAPLLRQAQDGEHAEGGRGGGI